jgi:hypothetical protein
MKAPTFTKLNQGWNAEPNDPAERMSVEGSRVALSFALNPWAYDAAEGESGRLTFTDCARWRLGPTNDEGWYRGACRYSGIAPVWGEFYELTGPDPDLDRPKDWRAATGSGARHFLFYLRDNTFECIAADWSFSR